MSDSLVAGCVSGALTRLLTCPLDVLKIRFQLQLEPISQVCAPHPLSVSLAECSVWVYGQGSQISKYRGVLDAVWTIFKEEGILAFWYNATSFLVCTPIMTAAGRGC